MFNRGNRWLGIILIILTLALAWRLTPSGVQEAAEVETAVSTPFSSAEPTSEPEPTPIVEEAVSQPVAFERVRPIAVASGAWQTFSNGNTVRDVLFVGEQLWAATDGGVVVWDGERRRLIAHWTAANGLLNNNALSLTVCPLPTPHLVVGTERGLSLFHLATETWRSWTVDNGRLPHEAPVTALGCLPEEQRLLVGYRSGGLAWWHPDSGWQLELLIDWPEDKVNELVAVDANTIWLAHDDGVTRFFVEGEATYFDAESALDDQTSGEAEQLVRAMAVDADGTAWFGQTAGLTRVSTDGGVNFYAGTAVSGWPFSNRVDGLAVGDDGTIWTTSAFGGVCQFDPKGERCLQTFEGEAGMAEDFNNRLAISKNGLVAYGSGGDGVSLFDGESWYLLRLSGAPSSNAFRDLTLGEDGRLWVGGFAGGYRIDPDQPNDNWEDIGAALGGVPLNTFYGMSNGMWVGHDAGASFFVFESSEWRHLPGGQFPGQGLAGGRVTAIAQDGNNHFWFGTSVGLTVWDGESFSYTDLLTDDERNDGVAAHLIQALLWDSEAMWVGTNRALFRISAAEPPEKFTPEQLGLDVERVSVFDLALDEAGRLLIAADSTLVVRELENGRFDLLHEATANIRAINVTQTQGIWLGLQTDRLLTVAELSWERPKIGDKVDDRFAGVYLVEDGAGRLWMAGRQGGGVTMLAEE